MYYQLKILSKLNPIDKLHIMYKIQLQYILKKMIQLIPPILSVIPFCTYSLII
jgi:hypothetical protein